MDPSLLNVLKQGFAGHHEVQLALLFGSRARGTFRADSDIDLAVQGHSIDRLALACELSLMTDLEVDVIDLHSDMGVPLLEELLRDGLRVYEAQSGLYAQWRSHALATLETDRPWFRRMREGYLKKLASELIRNG